MARISFTLVAGLLLAVGIPGVGSATANGNLLSNILSAELVIRSLASSELPSQSPLPPPRIIGHEAKSPAKVPFRYDAIEPVLDEPVVLTEQSASDQLPTSIEGPIPLASEIPLSPVRTMSSTVDPFFGGVVQLLGARSDQPFCPIDAIRPPAPPHMINGQSMVAVPADAAVNPLASLRTLAAGEVLDMRTRQYGTMPGRAVLLADGKALLLQNADWNDEQVKLQLPLLKLSQPTLGRVFVARADGVVVECFDFMLMPRAK